MTQGKLEPAVDRFWPKVDTNGPPPPSCPDLGPCWIWLAGKKDGYGTFWDGTRKLGAHRFAYLTLVGPIPEGFELDHLCRVTHCVNPSHLEAVTPRVNQLRSNGIGGVNARKTHCPQGHPYNEANTSWRAQADGMRRTCRECNRQRSQDHRKASRLRRWVARNFGPEVAYGYLAEPAIAAAIAEREREQ